MEARALSGSRAVAFSLLALTNLLWSGNWVLGRALRDTFDPVTLNFWRWAIAAAALLPFAWPHLKGQWAVVRRHAGLLALLALLGVVLFQTLVYHGLRTTTAINAVLLNSSQPLFMLLCSWIVERERPTGRQLAGMLISITGILVILTQGEFARLLHLEFHSGDAWILLAMPMWGLYSVLLKRRPPQLSGVALAFVIAIFGLVMLAPLYALQTVVAPSPWPSAEAAGALLYVGVGASMVAFLAWNRGVAMVGANAAGFTLNLLPAFATVLAILFLGETFHVFHAVGVATILAGVILATR